MIVRPRVQRFIYSIAALGVLAALTCPLGCPPPQPPHRDATDGAMLINGTALCAHLGELGCAAALSQQCDEVLDHVVDAGLERIDRGCIMRAQTKQAAATCAAPHVLGCE